MDKQNKVDGTSRRKFIKIAAATAYVAPLIASMPAHATFKKTGSQVVKKPVYRSYRKPVKRFSKVRRFSKSRSRSFSKFRRW